jgi:prefoldin subunit 5
MKLNKRSQIYDEEFTHLQEQRQMILQSIESLLDLVNRVEKAQARPNIFRRFSELVSPLVTSLLLPALLEQSLEVIFP